MTKVNIFICQTPFHSFICSHLAKTVFANSTNWFISSVPNYSRYPGQVLVIQNGLVKKINGLTTAKNFIKGMAKAHSSGLTIFLPHIDGVLSNYVFHSILFSKRAVMINFFYEGVVMLDADRQHRIYPRNIFKKKILSFFLFRKFKEYKDILPLESKRISKIFTPHPENTPGPKEKMVRIEFPKSQYSIIKQRCVIIGLDETEGIELLYLNLLEFVKSNPSIREIFFKPHYSDRLQIFQKIALQQEFKYEIIQSIFCIEEIISEYRPEFVVCPYLSSALINLKVMHGDEIEIVCVTNESALTFSGAENLEFAKNNGVKMIISQSA